MEKDARKYEIDKDTLIKASARAMLFGSDTYREMLTEIPQLLIIIPIIVSEAFDQLEAVLKEKEEEGGEDANGTEED